MANTDCYLDANVCIAFIQQHHPFHRQAVNFVLNAVTSGFFLKISPLVLDETIHILLRDYRLGKVSLPIPKTKRDLRHLLSLPSLSLVNPPTSIRSQLRVLNDIQKFRLSPRDAYHLLIMKHHRINYFSTFDHDFDLVFSAKTLKQWVHND